MTENSTNRRLGLWAGILVLSCAVFCWGLQYKLSLYDAHPTNSVPVAKLLAGKGDAKTTIEQAAQTQIKPIFPETLIGLWALVCGVSLLGTHIFAFRRTVQISMRPQRAGLNHFSFRPPPFLS